MEWKVSRLWIWRLTNWFRRTSRTMLHCIHISNKEKLKFDTKISKNWRSKMQKIRQKTSNIIMENIRKSIHLNAFNIKSIRNNLITGLSVVKDYNVKPSLAKFIKFNVWMILIFCLACITIIFILRWIKIHEHSKRLFKLITTVWLPYFTNDHLNFTSDHLNFTSGHLNFKSGHPILQMATKLCKWPPYFVNTD